MSDTATIFVVDDDEPVRDAIGMLLETVGLPFRSFGSGQEFLDAFEPDMVGCLVLDIRMPGISGLDVQERLLELDAGLPTIFITGHGDVPMAVEAMRRGAVDFIRKPFRDQELLNRVNEALQLGEESRERNASLEDARTRVASLTPRETEVFHRVAKGEANKVIAIELGISERTVEIHRSQAMHKTESRTLADLVRLKLLLDTSESASPT